MRKNRGSILTISTAITAITLADFFVFYSPVTLAQNSERGTRRRPSATECEVFASDFARSRANGGVIGGAVGGAASGALLGNLFGGRRGAGRRAGQGASAGAVVGGVAGGSRQSSERDRLHRLAFDDCMQGNVDI